MSLQRHLDAIFDADRTLREAESRLFAEGHDSEALVDVLESASEEAASLDDRTEAAMRLERLADLCAQVPGPRMADVLLRILDAEDTSVRVAAGEALLDVGYERYAEVARAIERALDRGETGPAMAELPWLLAEIGEPSAVPLLRRFTEHPDADVVAAAVEAFARLGDPAAVSTLQQLVQDTRRVTLDDDVEEPTTRATVGELAQAAIEELGGDGQGE